MIEIMLPFIIIVSHANDCAVQILILSTSHLCGIARFFGMYRGTFQWNWKMSAIDTQHIHPIKIKLRAFSHIIWHSIYLLKEFIKMPTKCSPFEYALTCIHFECNKCAVIINYCLKIIL